MKVVLLKEKKKVGKKGEIVKVADGYGQNFLIKNKLAVKETATAKKIVEQQKEEQPSSWFFSDEEPLEEWKD